MAIGRELKAKLEEFMKIYRISLAAGLLVGVVYALLQVRSPAPPAIALVGLLGMLVGEQLVPTVKRIIAGKTVTESWIRSECVPKISGIEPAPKDAPRGDATSQCPELEIGLIIAKLCYVE